MILTGADASGQENAFEVHVNRSRREALQTVGVGNRRGAFFCTGTMRFSSPDTSTNPARLLLLPLVAVLVSCGPVLVADDETPVIGSVRELDQRSEDAGRRQDATRPGKGRRQRQEGRSYPYPKQAWDIATLILGRPGRESIAISVYPYGPIEGFIEYGTPNSPFSNRTDAREFQQRQAAVVELTGLTANTRYVYRLSYRTGQDQEFERGPVYGFHTQRAPGSTFSFQLQGDSHPERNPKQNLPAMYEQTLLSVADDQPDFYLAMGDDFSVDNLKERTPVTVENVYLKQLPYLGLVGHSSPLFLVNGNHEQAAKYLLDGTAENVAVWAQNSRNRYFPQPAPDDFYGGNSEPVEHIGLLRNYFSWTWGDALFVVIDPYWHSDGPVDNRIDGSRKSGDHWERTLGDTQYQWLQQTLEQSTSRFKFVFAHHVNGTGRGGARVAGLYEWGGYDRQGQWAFNRQRPGWSLPIHQLMAKNRVTIFFQGHDHVFATEELDGVIYQTVPEPADPNYALYFEEAFGGTVLPNSGRIRVTVSPGQVDAEYVSTVLPTDENGRGEHNSIAHHYSIKAESGQRGAIR